MATVEATKEYEIDKKIGMHILEDYFYDYDCYVDRDEEICFDDLNIKNSLIFLEELKDQFIDAMDDIIEKYKQAEEHYKNGDVRLDFKKVMLSLYK